MLNKIIRSPITTVLLFVLAAALLLAGTIGGTRAAGLISTEQNYRASLALANLSVGITENGTAVSGEDALFKTLLADNGDEKLKIGKDYSDTLAVANNGGEGAVPEYVRVTLTRYWMKDGAKLPQLDPELIELKYDGKKLDYKNSEFAEGWVVDTVNSTDERIVLYYTEALEPGAVAEFIDTVTISGAVLTSVTKAGDSVDYDYEKVTFHVDAVADSVQVNNADKAITSAWGYNFLEVE